MKSSRKNGLFDEIKDSGKNMTTLGRNKDNSYPLIYVGCLCGNEILLDSLWKINEI